MRITFAMVAGTIVAVLTSTSLLAQSYYPGAVRPASYDAPPVVGYADGDCCCGHCGLLSGLHAWVSSIHIGPPHCGAPKCCAPKGCTQKCCTQKCAPKCCAPKCAQKCCTQKCAPKCCAPKCAQKCCTQKCCAPKCCAPKGCTQKCCTQKCCTQKCAPKCCAPKCSAPCGGCGHGGGLLSSLPLFRNLHQPSYTAARPNYYPPQDIDLDNPFQDDSSGPSYGSSHSGRAATARRASYPNLKR